MGDESVFDDDVDPADGDSAVLGGVSQPRLLQVYSTEPVVVGFGGASLPDDHNLSAYREELRDLLEKHGRGELAFDLTGVSLVPSGIVGLFESLVREGVRVSVFNASREVREVFAVTQTDQRVSLHDVDVSPSSDAS